MQKNWRKSLLIRGNSMCEDKEVAKDLVVWFELNKSASRYDTMMDREREASICRSLERSFD